MAGKVPTDYRERHNDMNPLHTVTNFAGGLIHTARARLSEWIDPHGEVEHPDPIWAARVALAMATAASQNNHDHGAAFQMVSPILQEMHPFHMVDVSMSLASMVASLADEEDLARFGMSILDAEVSR